MKPIRTREELLAFARAHAPSVACQRAIDEGRACNLGGFSVPDHRPTYVVHVLSSHGREWLIRVAVGDYGYGFSYPDRVPWAYWDGTWGGKRLIDGDQ